MVIIWSVYWLGSKHYYEKNHSMGLLANIIVGLVGSALGLWLMELLGFGKADAFSLVGMLVSIGGAALLIAIISALTRRR